MEMKPIGMAFGLFLLVQVAYLALIAGFNTLPPVVIWLPYVAVILCAVITGYLATSHRFVQLAILGLLMAVIVGGSNYAWSVIGMPADLHGIFGALLIGGLSLPFILALSMAGGFLGGVLHDKART